MTMFWHLLRLTAVLTALLGLSTSVAAMSFLPGGAVPQAQPVARSTRANPLLADAVLVKKGQRRLYLLHHGKPFRTYRVSLGIDPVGHKERRGDNRTPEGHYLIDWRNPNSRFHRSLHISYPNEQDRLYAARQGWDPGGMIMIHGQPHGRGPGAVRDLIAYKDWTEGCIAVSNLAIDEIWRFVPNGTPIEIRP